MTPSNTRLSQASQSPTSLFWFRDSVTYKTAGEYSVELTQDDDGYIYTSKHRGHVLGIFSATNERASMEQARDDANEVCEKHLALTPMRRAAYIAAGGVRLAAVGVSVKDDIISTLNHDQLQQVIDNPDVLIALHNSRVLPNTAPIGGTTARGLASDRGLSLPNTPDSVGDSHA